MKFLTIAAACCAVLAGAPASIAAAQAPVRAATGDQAVAGRFQVALAAIGQANAILRSTFASGLAQPTDLEDLVAKIDAQLPAVEANLAELTSLRATMVALPPFGAGSGLQGKVADDFTRQAIAQIDATRTALESVRALKRGAEAGDLDAVNKVLRGFQSIGATTLQGAAIASRARAELFPPGQSQGNQGRAGAALLEGMVVVLRQRAGELTPEQAARLLPAKAAEIRTETAAGRAALTREVRNGPADPRQRALMDQVVPLQRESFDIVEGGAALLAAAEQDLRQGRPTDARITEFNAMQLKLQGVLERQTAMMARGL